MAWFYSNENFPLPVVKELRNLGHDVLTTEEAGKSDQAIMDEEVLSFATSLDRAVLTFNRKHFIRIHNSGRKHAGILVCTFDIDFKNLALRIHNTVNETNIISGQLVRINRPHK